MELTKNNRQYTSGPWALRLPKKEGKSYAKIDAKSWTSFAKVVVRMDGVYGVHDVSDGHANARLIAAAPELLEALEILIEKCLRTADTTLMHEELLRAQQSVNKAYGTN